MHEQIISLIEAAVRLQDQLLETPIDVSSGENSPLFGSDGQIDSLTLVSLIVDIESRIRSEFEVEVRLADTSDLPESATPFATIGSMSKYVLDRLRTEMSTETPIC